MNRSDTSYHDSGLPQLQADAKKLPYLGHDHFLLDLSQVIYHPTIWCCSPWYSEHCKITHTKKTFIYVYILLCFMLKSNYLMDPVWYCLTIIYLLMMHNIWKCNSQEIFFVLLGYSEVLPFKASLRSTRLRKIINTGNLMLRLWILMLEEGKPRIEEH
jgi:hypothetical protein